jgi:transcriptional regulator with XRE-family HTH domain
MSGTYLRQVEEGARNPGLEQLVRLARAFDLSSLEQLFGPLPTEGLL